MLRYRVAIAGALLLPVFCVQANPLGLMLTRLHEPVYAPGMPLEIVVTVEAGFMEGLLAMGLYENLPQGWRFEGVSSGGSGLPAIMPAPGDGPHLEFAWITPPPMPCSFSYTVMPPADSWGIREIHGVLEYRMEEGPYYLPDKVTVLDGPEEAEPTLILRGAQLMEVMQGDIWEEPGYTALDARLQDISSRVVVAGEVQTETPGTYTIKYSVTSESGAKATEAQRVVRVMEREETDSETAVGSARSMSIAYGEKEKQVLSSAGNVVEAIRAESTDIVKEERKTLQFPELSAFRPIFSGEYKKDEQDGVVEENVDAGVPVREGKTGETVVAVSVEVTKRGVRQQETTGDGYAMGGVQDVEREYAGYIILILTGVVLMGLMTGAWFVFRSKGRSPSHPEGKKK